MRRLLLLGLLILLLNENVFCGELQEDASDLFGTAQVEAALPEDAQSYLGDIRIDSDMDFSRGLSQIISGALGDSGSALKNAAGISVQISAIVLLVGMLRGFGDSGTVSAVELAAVLAIGLCCMGRISGFFSRTAETVDSMSAFSGFLFSALAAATAATGAVGTSTALYGVTVALCGILSRLLQTVFLPAISCYMALALADHAVGDGGLSMAADTVKQLVTLGLKLAVVAFTAYLSVTGVVSGSADLAAVKAAKLTISTAVPVVGSMIADASETLLVSAGLIRSSVGIFGLLGVLAVSIGPFIETGLGYLSMKCTAAVAAAAGEKQLSGLISAMAGAIGLITALVGVSTLLIMISCVCFMRSSLG